MILIAFFYNKALERRFFLKLLTSNVFIFPVQFSRKSTPTYVGRIQEPRGYLTVEGTDFCGEILRAYRRIFRAQNIDGKTERAPDNVTEQNAERTKILQTGRNKGSKKVLRLSGTRHKMSRDLGNNLDIIGGNYWPAAMNTTVRVPLVCNSVVITLSYDCTDNSIESTIV